MERDIYIHRKKILIPMIIVMLAAEVILSYIIPIETPKPLQERVTDIETIVEKVQNEIINAKDETGSLLEKTQKLEGKVELLMRKRPRIVLREPSETDPYISVDEQFLSVFAEISDDYGIEENSINLMLDNEIIRDKPRIEKVSDTLLYVRYNIIRLFDCRPYYVTLSAKNILGAENTIIRRIIVYYPVEEWTFTEKKQEKVSEDHEKIELTAEDNIIEWTSKKKWPGDITIECWIEFMNFPPIGSYGTERATEISDIDLLIIKKTNKRFVDRTVELIQLVRSQFGFKYPVEPLVYTPNEFKKATKINSLFIRTILLNGVVLYEKE